MSSELGGLPELADYAFLSDPEAQEVFVVERDGRVWAHTEQVKGIADKERMGEVLFRLEDHLAGGRTWSWLDGWLPALAVENGDRGRLDLLAAGERLFVSDGHKAWRFPGRIEAPVAEFEAHKEGIRRRWSQWFAAGRELPDTHPHLDAAWRSSLIQAKMAYTARHPHYGVAGYGRRLHDGFPPTTLTLIDCLLDFEHTDEALDRLGYFMDRFVMPDGQIDYYGVSISEYGGFFNLFTRVADSAQGREWLRERLSPIRHMLAFLLRNRIAPLGGNPLLFGAPEADQREDKGVFFHNAALVWRGLSGWAGVAEALGEREMAMEAAFHAQDLGGLLAEAVAETRDENGLVASRYDREENFRSLTGGREASYANYRYYPELLEANFLDREDAGAIMRAREQRQGESHGVTLFRHRADHPYAIDDWPLGSYARGLIELGERERFMRALVGHALHSMTRDTFTAYEQVQLEGDPRRALADFCVPAQLVLPRMMAWSFSYRKYDGSLVEWGGPDVELLDRALAEK